MTVGVTSPRLLAFPPFRSLAHPLDSTHPRPPASSLAHFKQDSQIPTLMGLHACRYAGPA
eukprot:432484-Rhodomonas_salina.2